MTFIKRHLNIICYASFQNKLDYDKSFVNLLPKISLRSLLGSDSLEVLASLISFLKILTLNFSFGKCPPGHGTLLYSF